MVEPHECAHPKTTIDVAADGEKVETCVVCDGVVTVHKIETPKPTCGYETDSGGNCQRTVSNPDEHCWQHP